MLEQKKIFNLEQNPMKTGTISIPDIDFDYKLWKNFIDFQRKQVRTYLNRISEFKVEPERNHNMQELMEIELTLHNMQADLAELNRSIKLQEELISANARDYPIDISHEHFEAHERIFLLKKEVDRKFYSIEDTFNKFRI
jgi:hypothetical protein